MKKEFKLIFFFKCAKSFFFFSGFTENDLARLLVNDFDVLGHYIEEQCESFDKLHMYSLITCKWQKKSKNYFVEFFFFFFSNIIDIIWGVELKKIKFGNLKLNQKSHFRNEPLAIFWCHITFSIKQLHQNHIENVLWW